MLRGPVSPTRDAISDVRNESPNTVHERGQCRRSPEIETSRGDLGDNTKRPGEIQSKNQEGIAGRAPFVPRRIRSRIGRLVKVQEERERTLARVSFPVRSLERDESADCTSDLPRDRGNFRIK